MQAGIHDAWREVERVFDRGTLRLTGKELQHTRSQARPFLELVAGQFGRALKDNDALVSEKVLTNKVRLHLKGWRDPMELKYPTSSPDPKRTWRHSFAKFEMSLPTGDLRLRLRFRLGEGERADNTWNMMDWGLGTWGTRDRVQSEAIPTLLKIQSELGDPDLMLDHWEGVMEFKGIWAQIGRTMEYNEFGADLEKSVMMVAVDFERLVEAALAYQQVE